MHISGDTDRSIIFVHECGFKPSAADYLDALIASLAAGIACDHEEALNLFGSVNKYLAYYSDLSKEFLAAQSQYYDEKLDISDLASALHELKGIDRKKGFRVGNYDKLPGKSSFKEFAVSLLAPLLSAVGLEKRLVAGISKDLGEYWIDGSDLNNAILERVRTTIQTALDRDERIMLIAHGTGAIVAYDALWQLSHDPHYADQYKESKIDVFLTLGCPLSDSTVRRQLKGARRKGRERFPTNIVAWHNVAAEDDYICHDHTVGNDFKAMLKQRQVSTIRDYHIYNMVIRYGISNPHSAVGYLVHPRVTRIVLDWLTQSFGNSLPKSIF